MSPPSAAEPPQSLSEEDVAFAGVSGQLALLAAGRLTSRRLVEVSLSRISRHDGALHAFREVWAERALAEADLADAARARGEAASRPLLGVPVAIKDATAVSGVPVRAGTRSPEPPAPADSALVRALREAGAVPVGLTTSPELALWPFTESPATGPTRNPWSPAHQTGGSSGGAAVAVAAGLVPLAHASDGGGSIRIPAAACGLVGLKPTVGRVPLEEPSPDGSKGEHWHGLTSNGFVTRSVEDTARALDAVLGPAAGQPGAGLLAAVRAGPGRALTVAVTEAGPLPARVHPQVRAALEETAALLQRLGHTLVRGRPAYGAVQPGFLARYLRGAHDDWRRLKEPGACEARTRGVARLGALVPERALAHAKGPGRDAARERLSRFPGGADVLLLPTLATPPPPVGRWEGKGALATLLGVSGYMPHTPAFNVTGQPALSIPAGFTPEGLPLAVQLVARMGEDALLLALAAQLERERDWTARRPPLR
jgi:amidase